LERPSGKNEIESSWYKRRVGRRLVFQSEVHEREDVRHPQVSNMRLSGKLRAGSGALRFVALHKGFEEIRIHGEE
jgi:hypothetical protein